MSSPGHRPWSLAHFAIKVVEQRVRNIIAIVLMIANSQVCAAVQGKTQTPEHMGLGGRVPTIKTESQLRRFLDDLESQRFLLTIGLGIEGFHQWVGSGPHLVTQFTRFNNQLLARKDYAAVIDRWRGKVKDPLLARRLEVQHADFLISRADPAVVQSLGDAQVRLQDALLAFRCDMGGTRVTPTQLAEVARLEGDRGKRRQAFLAFQQGAKAHRDQITRCMKLNDRVSRSQGFSHGSDASLNLQGLSRKRVLADIEQFEQLTRPMMLELLATVKRDLQLSRAETWDIDYWLHTQETADRIDPWSRTDAVPRLNSLMKAIGFEPEKRMINMTIRDVPVGGIAFPIRPPYESRFLTNPFSGSEFYITLFHEYAHALNSVLIDRNLPAGLLNLDAPPLSEGVAECLGHFAYDRNWLGRTTGLALEKAARLERIGKLQLLLWLRRTVCLNSWVELHAYDNLDADLDALFAKGFQKFMCCELPNGRFFGMTETYGTSPLSIASYLYANMIATQLREAMRKKLSSDDLSADPRVGPWLTKHIFLPGLTVAWDKKIFAATGKALGTEALARFLRPQ